MDAETLSRAPWSLAFAFDGILQALAEVFTWVTDDTTAAAAVRGGWPCADVIAVSRLDSEFFSAVVCDG